MRIFIASGIFHPETGGPATYLYHLLPELQALGHEVSVLSFGEPASHAYPYPVTRISRRQPYVTRHLAYYRAAATMWPGHDLAYVHTLGLYLPRRIRPRLAKIVGDTAWERAMNRGWIPPDTDVDRFQIERQSLPAELNKLQRAHEARRFDHIIVPSEYLKRMVIGWGVRPERITVIYNALQSEPALTGISQAEARRQLALPEGPLLLTAARLVPWKGIDHTLHALSRLPDIHLVVAGDGPARPALEALAARLNLGSRVIFAGSVPRHRLALYLRAADYGLLYSGYEGLPHFLLESLSAGTPVIASDKGGNPEVVQHDVNGLLVPYVDREALTAALEAAFRPGERQRLATHASDGLERFSWDRLLARTVATLQAVAGM